MLNPDAHFAAETNRDIDGRLTRAFDHLLVEVLGLAPGSGANAAGPAAHALQALMREAAVAGDVEGIRRLHDEHRATLDQPVPAGGCRVVSLSWPDLRASDVALLQSAFRDDVGLTTQLVPPSAEEVERLRRDVETLREGLSGAVPLWWQELATLVSLIVLAESASPEHRFAGASAFAAWGAILVNPRAQSDLRTLALTLIHESSHLKLFSAYLDDEIVLNDPDETYSSPLRREPRPMNGIYHAAYVLARMVDFSEALLRSGQADAVFGQGGAAGLRTACDASATAFEAAHDVIARHGRLTERGAAIMAEAAAAVARAREAKAAA